MSQASRRSIRYVPGAEHRDWSGHAHLFARDIPLGIMPTWRLRRNDLAIEFATTDESSKAKLLTLLRETAHYGPHSFEEAVCDFVEDAATQMAHTGQAAYEICRRDDEVQLLPITEGRIVSVAGLNWQKLPRQQQHDDGPNPLSRRYIYIPGNALWRLRLPRGLGTPRQHRRTLRNLERASTLVTAFAVATPDLGRRVGYDFVVHRDASDRVQERLTRRWGSTLSLQRPVGTSSEYFFIARRLAFHRAQAMLREHLIASLNRLLPELGITGVLKVVGLPSAQSIEDVLGQLHAGEVSFGEALGAVRL